MANELFIKHKLVDQIPSSPEVGSIYYERNTGIEKVVESESSILEVGNIEKMLSAKIGEGQNSNIFNDLDNVASGDNSHAEGSNTTASGQCAHVEGSSTTASGEFAHAEGYNTVAAGDYSHAEGYGTVANNISEHAEGSWNISSDNTIFSIGNGIDTDNRSNLYEIHSDGSIFVKNVGDYDGTNAEDATDLATVLNDTTDKVNTINTTVFQTKTDETLTTTDKTVVGAINDLSAEKQNASDDTLTTISKEIVGAINELVSTKQPNLVAGDGIKITDNTISVTLDTDVFVVETVLPSQPASGNEKKIYIVPATSPGAQNLYDEYVWVNSAWELLGQFQPVIDLTPYLTKTEAADMYQPKGSYQTTLVAGNLINIDGAEISVDLNPSLYQTKEDSTLQTTNKTIVEAINEVDDMVPDVIVVPELTDDYTIQANSSVKRHVYIIPVGATKYNILYSGDITWRNGEVPTTQANHTYVVTVFSNLGFWDEF